MPAINYTLNLTTGPFEAGLRRGLQGIAALGGAVRGLSGLSLGSIAKLGNILFKLPDQARAVQGILSGLTMPLKLAASLETTSVAFKTLVGDATEAALVLDQIKQLGAETPFEFPELANAARMLVAFGENAGTVTATLRRLGDIASGTGINIGELAQIYGKARVQGTLFAEEINELTGRGIPVIQQFAAQLGVSENAVKQLASEGKVGFKELEQAFINMTAPGGQFAGMMQQLSGTMEGTLSTLADNAKSILSGVGEHVNEAVKPLLKDLADELGGMEGAGEKIGQTIALGIDMAVAGIKDGTLIELLEAGLKAAGLTFADTLVDAADLLVDRLMAEVSLLGAKLNNALNPFGGEANLRNAEAALEYERGRKLSDHGVGSNELEEGKQEAQRRFKELQAAVTRSGLDRQVARAEAAERSDRERADEARRAEVDKVMEAAIERIQMARIQATTDAAMKRARELGLTEERMNPVTGATPAAAPPEPAATISVPPAASAAVTTAPAVAAVPDGGERSDRAPGDRKIRRKSQWESLTNAYWAQANTGSGSVGWREFLDRQIGLTDRQIQWALEKGPNYQQMDGATGRGQDRRQRAAAEARVDEAGENARRRTTAMEQLLRRIAAGVERLVRAAEDENRSV